jgi:hypothetical protein
MFDGGRGHAEKWKVSARGRIEDEECEESEKAASGDQLEDSAPLLMRTLLIVSRLKSVRHQTVSFLHIEDVRIPDEVVGAG